jgi:branched-chain amino acid transport system permease protein
VKQFLGFAIPGVPFGCTYALFAIGLILTYQGTGVFSFAFAAQAYASAFVFSILTLNEHWPVWLAFLVSVVVLAPAIGLAFDYFLFRHIPNTNGMAKLVTSIGLLVGIPSLLTVIFTNQPFYGVPSILFNPNNVYFHLFGLHEVPLNGTFLSTVLVTAVVLLAMVVLMRFTNLGLKMRATVENRRLVQLDGINSNRVVAYAWAISSLLAGLAGVLLAPQFAQLEPENYITLMVAAFAAAAWGVLRSMPIAALVAIGLGVVEFTAQGYLPTGGILYDSVLPVLPVIALVAALLFVPGMRSLDDTRDPLASVNAPTPPTAAASRTPTMDKIIRVTWYVVLVAFTVSMLTWMPRTWEGVFNQGIAFSVIFLSITLITGMGGHLSLAQATLAGIGAFTAGQLARHFGLSLLVGGIVGAGLAAAVAVILALVSLRLKGLGLTLMTLAAALVFDQAVFSRTAINGGQSGLSLQSKWAGLGIFNPNGHSLFIVGMVVLIVVTLAILQLRKGTIAHYLGAMRGSETAAAGIGINLTWLRVLIFALSGAVAAIGGTIYSLYQTNVNANSFNYELSLVFVVVVVITGVSTVEGAIAAGVGLTIIEQLVTYLPGRFGGESLVFMLFAFGALTYASHPEGVLEFEKRTWTARFERVFLTKEVAPSVAPSRDDPTGHRSSLPASGAGFHH